MPTSAGKTRAIELVIRSAFFSARADLAVVVAPFRALCTEITHFLRGGFSGEDVHLNELSDALQVDYSELFADLLVGAVWEFPTELRRQGRLSLSPRRNCFTSFATIRNSSTSWVGHL